MEPNDGQQQAQDEQKWDLIQAATHAVEAGTPEADVRLLCWGCGIDYDKEVKCN